MNILFDGNFLFHKCFSVFSTYYRGRDMKEVLNTPEDRQVLIRKCVIDMCHAISKFKDVERVAFVIDSTSWRYSLHDDYKYSLTRVKSDYYQEFLECLDSFEALLRKRGLIVSRVWGAEGDDLLYLWSIYFSDVLNEELVIVTGDSDIRQIITDKVSIYTNNSKNLRFFCLEGKQSIWEDYFDDSLEIVGVKPFEVLLYKVIMGDTSDNVPKIKQGVGPRAFEKFIAQISPYVTPENIDVISMSQWISKRFSEFSGMKEEDILGKIIFNLKLTWLNLSVYNSHDYITKNGKSLLENILQDILDNKDKYNYNKSFTLEDFYGMVIK